MFELTHEHADSEDCLNASNGKYKSRNTDKADPSSFGKKDRKRRGEFVANTEKRGSNKQREGQNNRGKFNKIMNNPCQNHGFPVTHLAKDCNTYKQHIAQEGGKESRKGNPPNKGKRGGDDEDQGEYPNVQDTMLIFGGLKAHEDRLHQKLTHRQIYATAPVVPIYLC